MVTLVSSNSNKTNLDETFLSLLNKWNPEPARKPKKTKRRKVKAKMGNIHKNMFG
jgi:hypothetical protein